MLLFLTKAEESLQAAKTLLDNELYNDAVSRAYYACFQIACVALHQYDIINIDDVRQYRHKDIIGFFVAKLINEKKVYSKEIRSYLHQLLDSRMIADYEPHTTFSAEKAKERVEWAIYFYGIVKESLK